MTDTKKFYIVKTLLIKWLKKDYIQFFKKGQIASITNSRLLRKMDNAQEWSKCLNMSVSSLTETLLGLESSNAKIRWFASPSLAELKSSWKAGA